MEACLIYLYHEFVPAFVPSNSVYYFTGVVFPDPFSLGKDWLDENQGMAKWPSLYFEDIATFLRPTTPCDLQRRLLNEYKEGKAYR